jgi:predicted GNAT family N-acyltransferase
MTHDFGVNQPPKGSEAEWNRFRGISPGLAIGRVALHWFDEIGEIVRARISPNTASAETMRRVQSVNSDSFWGLFRREEGGVHRLEGFYGQLLLSEAGHAALVGRTLNRVDPPRECLAPAGTRPDAAYMWCAVAKKKAALMQATIASELQYLSGIPYYAALATEDGLKIGRQLGMKPVTPQDDRAGGLFKLPPVLPRMQMSISNSIIRVKVVETAEELDHAKTIRAATFMSEQDCPFNEEFDGNDFSAQHIVGYVNDEPAATIRIRYFAAFVKFERYAVLKRFRKTGVKDELLGFAADLVRRKGYTQIYFHAEARLTDFWSERGFSKFPRDTKIRFSDHEYIEIWKALAPHPDPLTMNSDPMVLNRPEGRWEVEGVLDKSAVRAGVQ